MVGPKIWLPIVLWVAVIWFMSQYGRVPDLTPWLTARATMVLGHIALYSCLGFFAARYLAFGLRLSGVLVLVFSTTLCATFGIADELHQRLVENRSADLDDLIADFAGGFIGSLAYLGLASLIARIRKEQNGPAKDAGPARPGYVLGFALVLLVLLPMLIYSGIPETVFRFVIEERGLPETGMPTQRIRSPAPSSVGEEPRPTDHAESTKGKVIPQREATPAHTGAVTAQPASEDKDQAVTSGHKRVAGLGDTTVEGPISPALQAPTPEVEEMAQEAKHRKAIAAEEFEHLAALYKELADLETKEIHMEAYGPDYPPRAALSAKIEVFRARIVQIESRPVPAEAAARIKSQYVSVFKTELGRLEVKEMHMSKYSRQYPPRALLREKIDFLRKKIAHLESSPGDQSPGTFRHDE